MLTNDSRELWSLDEKLARYRQLGVRELVVFHYDATGGERLCVWDRIDDDFVERVVDEERTPCLTLGLHLVVAMIRDRLACVRLARDAEGTDLVPTNGEALAEAVCARQAAEAAREAGARARTAAEARVRELEARLAAGSGQT